MNQIIFSARTFQNCVISEGSKTNGKSVTEIAKFQNCVISEGSKTHDDNVVYVVEFQNCVISEGSKTSYLPESY